MFVMMTIVWLPILAFIALLLRATTKPRSDTPLPPPPPPADTAEEEARRTYARGEINRERFLEIMADLREHRSGG
jgi:uncharacterized membrane protein